MRRLLVDAGYLVAALVVGLPYLLVRALRRRPMASPWRRLGFVAPTPAGDGAVLWMHAVSVGEALAVRELVTRLRAARPSLRLVLSCTTPTGLDVARRSFGDAVRVVESPFDLSGAVRRFLRRVRPDALVLVELELWPNTLDLCARRGIPVMVVNGKISARSCRGYARLGRVLPGFPATGLGPVLVQEAIHGERLRSLGIPAERIRVAGNLKSDNVALGDPGPSRRRLRAEHGYGPDARIVVCGSTHPGEEAIWLEVARICRAREQNFRLVLVPRHPGRVKEVLDACRSEGVGVSLRAEGGRLPDPAILVVDSMGELHSLYSLADLAFVGGTLVPIGGHNLLEPASWGLPILVGPHLETVREMATALEVAGVVRVVADPEIATVSQAVLESLRDETAVTRAVAGAKRVFEAHRGAVDRALFAITETLDGSMP